MIIDQNKGDKEMIQAGNKVSWSVYGITYTGTVNKVMYQDSPPGLWRKGGLRVRVDDQHAWYKGQIVPVLPDRTIKVIG
jgi:hypothetical protein